MVLELAFLAAVAFLSATLIPLGSEAVVVTMVLDNSAPMLAVFGIASVANTLGACVNWWLGQHLLVYQHKRWFPVKARELARAQTWFQRYGMWSLLFVWMPLVGDGITVVAGVMKARFAAFVVLTLIGKSARYAAVIALAVQKL